MTMGMDKPTTPFLVFVSRQCTVLPIMLFLGQLANVSCRPAENGDSNVNDNMSVTKTPSLLSLRFKRTSLLMGSTWQSYTRAGLPRIKPMYKRRKEDTVILLMIILSGDCQPNPGPVKYPCGECSKAVAKTHRAVLCDLCNQLYHIKCAKLSGDQYKLIQNLSEEEPWYCENCRNLNECSICEQLHVVLAKHPGLCCDHCDKWYHTQCCNVPLKEYKKMQKNGASVTWICSSCELPNLSDSLLNSSGLTCTSRNNSFSILAKQTTYMYAETETQMRNHPKSSPPSSRKSCQRKTKMKILLVNCRSLRSNIKQAEFQALINSEDPDIVLASETHLDDTFASHSGLPPGYCAYRTNSYLGSGGTLLAFKEDILMSPVKNGPYDVTWGKILTFGQKAVYIGSLYRNPSSNMQLLESLEDNLSKMVSGQSLPLIILGGDVNLPDIDWETNSVKTMSAIWSRPESEVHEHCE